MVNIKYQRNIYVLYYDLIDSTTRSDESYLQLITKEHQLIKNEMLMVNSLRSLEETERDLFTKFSQKLRDAHEVKLIIINKRVKFMHESL